MNKKIIVVEDDVKAAKVMTLRLKSAGYHVITAYDGVEALTCALSEKPDMVITDLWMPVGMGFALAYRLRESFPTLPILFVTGQRPAKLMQSIESFGCARLLEKPYQAPDLLKTVAEMLHQEVTVEKEFREIMSESSEISPGGKRVLVVEDDRKIALSLSWRLKSAGYETIVATDALTAVSTALKEKPNLILLDISLPAGNGFTVAERVQALMPTLTPIIFLTASKQPSFRARAMELGAAGFFEKPFKSEALLAAVHEALQQQSDPEETYEKNDTTGRG